MSKTKERTKNQFLIAMLIILVLTLVIYFIFRNNYEWISLILPEFVGISWFGIMVAYAIKKTTSIKKFLVVHISILMLAIIGFLYGRLESIQFLVDFMPEFMGSTGIGVVLSLIFNKKIMV